MSPIRVLVVDDSVVIRKVVSQAIESDPELEVAGTAAHGRIALAKIASLHPDIVTLDVEMPEMDGLETLTELRKSDKDLPVIMFSSMTERGSAIALEALSRGASDYVAKPANAGGSAASLRQLREELLPRIKALVPAKAQSQTEVASHGAQSATGTGSKWPGPTHKIDAVVLGTSTGGPTALEKVFGAFTRPLNVPVLIVQHIPPIFSKMLAERLDRRSIMHVVEATDGMVIEPGTAYLAPGGAHMTVKRKGTSVVVETNNDPPANSCRPSVDVMFNSAAKVYRKDQLGVILTGMGNDGQAGCQTLHELGAPILSQDQATSVVWGMPAAVTNAGLADEVLPLGNVADRIALWVSAGSRSIREGAR